MTQSKIMVDGIDVFVEGDGPPVVMIHGWPDSYRLWESTVQRLKATNRCVRFSLPGYDLDKPPHDMTLETMLAFFGKVIDVVSPGEPVTLLVHDWGAVFGYQFAAKHPERVARVIGVDIGDTTSGDFVRSLTGKAKLRIAGYQLWLALARLIGKAGFGGLGDRMTRGMAAALRCPTEPSLICWQMNYPYKLQWTGGFKNAVRFTPHCPVLFIYGERKPFMFHSPRWIETVKATPGSALKGLPTGHWVMVQQPQAFNDCIANWLESR